MLPLFSVTCRHNKQKLWMALARMQQREGKKCKRGVTFVNYNAGNSSMTPFSNQCAVTRGVDSDETVHFISNYTKIHTYYRTYSH